MAVIKYFLSSYKNNSYFVVIEKIPSLFFLKIQLMCFPFGISALIKVKKLLDLKNICFLFYVDVND